MPYKYLSYYINQDTPLYGGKKNIFLEASSLIAKGDSSNSCYMKFPNHTGTHIDFPFHFSDAGKKINDYPPSFWKFESIKIINYKVEPNQIIDKDILTGNSIPKDTEFIIINTGFSKYRSQDLYWNNNPGIDSKLASLLRSECPKLRAIGFDFISLSSYQNRPLGRESHYEFLVENDILIIEDMKLEQLQNITILNITALPLLVDHIDGAPITILAEYH